MQSVKGREDFSMPREGPSLLKAPTTAFTHYAKRAFKHGK